MIRQIKMLVIGSLVWFASPCNSQSCANYSVTRSTGITYTTISGAGANSFAWRSLTGGATYDDNRSIFTPIGFDFWYLGIRYTHFCASTNGFVDFSTSTNVGTAGAAYGPANGNEFSVGGTGGTMLALAPVYDDLWPSSQGTTPLASSYLYKTTGSAPNRVLTVEWIGMEKWKAAPYWTTPPSLNFQLKIYETSGRIEFVYGTMTQGTATFDYACGINNFWTPAAAPTASQLLTQQTSNTTTFNNTPQNALNTVPASSTTVYFTPPAPSAAPSALSFSAVAQTSMELYWNDNASNELGYVILNSSDNVSFSFVNQLAAGSTSAAVTGLQSGTTYYWKVHAVTEGDLGSAASGTQATLASGTIVSVASGNWNTPATWNCTCVPTLGDHVTIANTHNVVLDANSECLSLTVGQGSSGQLTIGNSTTVRIFTVAGNITVNNGGVVTISNNNATHSLIIGGDIINNGTFNLSTTPNRHCNVTFTKDGNQSVSGTGATTYFNQIIMNMGNSSANILEISSSAFGARSGSFLTLTNGTFKLSAPCSNITLFSGVSTLSTSTGLWLNHPSAILSTGNTMNLFSTLRISAGTLSIGNASNENLLINGGALILEGGSLNVAGRLTRSGLTSRIDFTLSSGSLVLGTSGSTTGGQAMFWIDEQGSSFSMTGGTITLRRPGAGNLGFVNTSTTNVSVTGGTLFLGDASTPASQTISINTNNPIQNLVVGNGVAVTAALATNSLMVNNILDIESGNLNANNLPIQLGGNWINNGLFTAGTSSVTFNGSAAQTISGTSTTTFNTLVASNSSTSGITLNSPASLTGSLLLNSGIVYTDATNLLMLQSTAGASQGSSNSHVNGPMEKEGASAFVFPIGKNGRWARAGIGAPGSSSTFRAEYFDAAFTNTASVAASPTPAINNVSTQEHWVIDRTVGTGDAELTLFWEDASFSGINDCSASDLRIAHWNTGTSEWENNNNQVITTGTCSGATAGSISTSLQVTSFSPFTFGSLSSPINPLPIELLDFRASLNASGEVEIRWETATEINNDFFTLQRSSDAKIFEAIAEVDAAGNSSTRKYYAYNDPHPFSGITYYRLKQTDYDKTYAYSRIISVAKEGGTEFSLSPNPIQDMKVNLNLDLEFENGAKLLVYDAAGQWLFEQEICCNSGGGVSELEVVLNRNLPPGMYLVKLLNGARVYTSRLIVISKE